LKKKQKKVFTFNRPGYLGGLTQRLAGLNWSSAPRDGCQKLPKLLPRTQQTFNAMRELTAQQQQAIEQLSRFKVGALFMEPGTGKTATAHQLVCSESPAAVLWLCPKQIIATVQRELSLCGGFDCPVHFVAVESLSASSRAYLGARDICSVPGTFLVCDESLKIKNWTAIRTRRAIELGKLAEWRLILNGTPLSRNLLDLWAQMEFLSARILQMSMTRFKRTYCETVEYYRNGKLTGEQIVAYHNVPHLYALIAPYVYECDLEMGDLSKVYLTVTWHPTDEDRERYKELKEYWLNEQRLADLNNNIFLQMCQNMQHSYCTSPAKVQALRKVIATGRRTIVFCKFLDSAAAVREAFPDVTVLTFGRHAFGLNLQDHQQVVFFDQTWDYAQRIQAEGRIWRKGQTDTCYFVDLAGQFPLEKMIIENIERKEHLLDLVRREGAQKISSEL